MLKAIMYAIEEYGIIGGLVVPIVCGLIGSFMGMAICRLAGLW